MSGNEYIIEFIDWYNGWLEAFSVPREIAETVAHLLLEEIIPTFVTVTDNGSKNVNRVMKHTLQEINISHVSSSTINLKVIPR